MTWPKIRYSIYDLCGWQGCPKHKLWRAFVDVLIDNDEKVASFKKNTQFKTRLIKPYHTKMAKIDSLFMNKTAENPTLWAAHTYIAHIKEYPPPREKGKLWWLLQLPPSLLGTLGKCYWRLCYWAPVDTMVDTFLRHFWIPCYYTFGDVVIGNVSTFCWLVD